MFEFKKRKRRRKKNRATKKRPVTAAAAPPLFSQSTGSTAAGCTIANMHLCIRALASVFSLAYYIRDFSCNLSLTAMLLNFYAGYTLFSRLRQFTNGSLQICLKKN